MSMSAACLGLVQAAALHQGLLYLSATRQHVHPLDSKRMECSLFAFDPDLGCVQIHEDMYWNNYRTDMEGQEAQRQEMAAEQLKSQQQAAMQAAVPPSSNAGNATSEVISRTHSGDKPCRAFQDYPLLAAGETSICCAAQAQFWLSSTVQMACC